jgi:hypothetical protein
MDTFVESLRKLLDSQSLGLQRLVSIIIVGIFFLTPHIKDFAVSIGTRMTIKGSTKEIPDASSWRSFFRLLMCAAVFVAMAWVLMHAG